MIKICPCEKRDEIIKDIRRLRRMKRGLLDKIFNSPLEGDPKEWEQELSDVRAEINTARNAWRRLRETCPEHDV